MAISIDTVKELRWKTGAGLTDCKNALIEANGSLEEAIKILQKKGMAASITRSDKPTSEGRIWLSNDTKYRSIKVRIVKCETDFVANNSDFVALGNAENLEEAVNKLKISMRENIKIEEDASIGYCVDDAVGIYVHSDNKSGAVVCIGNVRDERMEAAKTFAKDCCLHLVAYTPAFIKKEDIPQSYIDEKREIFKAQMDKDPKMASKPDAVKEGILNGKINKHLAEITFMEQPFVKDDKKSVKEKMAEICGPSSLLACAELYTLN